MKHRWSLAAGFVLLVSLVIVLIVVAPWRAGPALTIEGSTISGEEFEFSLDTVKGEVAQEGAGKGSSVGPSDWAACGEGALSWKAMEAAVDDIVDRHALYSVAADAGLVDSDSWDELVERAEAENVGRAKSASAGGVVYGLTQYDLATFIQYDSGLIEEAYVSDADNPGMDLTEEEVNEHFASKLWSVSEGIPAELEDVRSNVVMDLRRTRFKEIVANRAAVFEVSIDPQALSKRACRYLSS